MKRLFLSLVMVVMGLGLVVSEADAKRFGGGGSSGMQRSQPSKPTPNSYPGANPSTTPGNPASPASPSVAPGAAGATAAAAAPRRSWMGPIAGLAAGLGLAALFSHLGLGAELANFMMLALAAVAAVLVIRFLMRRFAGNSARAAQSAPGGMSFQGASWAGGDAASKAATPANAAPSLGSNGFGGTFNSGGSTGSGGYSGASSGSGTASSAASGTAQGATGGFASAAQPQPAQAAQSFTVPPGFDVQAFERIAKMIFIRMQAANDVGDLNDLRQFTTPELFSSVRLDLQERGNSAQQTDVVKLDTEVLDIARENGKQVVSVRFHGLIREDTGGVATPFDEVWHLVKPDDGSREWAIAGIAQYA